MNPFTLERVARATDAASAVAARPDAMFLAGGTTLVDLMKIDVLTPDTVVDVRPLGLSRIDVLDDRIAVGAAVTNSQLAWHPVVRDRFPVLSEATLSGATTQIRNMATVAGNILQRTRCPYFRDVHASCNRREPGSGCDALDGFNRGHAVLGVSEHCIATHPSDMCVAMAVLDADVHTVRPNGTTRSIPFGEFHRAPGDTPHVEVALAHGELITHIVIPHLPAARGSHYLKVRDRASYEFALASAAVVLDLEGDTIRTARLSLGGIATRPWRATEAEHFLTGRKASDETFRGAAEIALTGAVSREHNHFKIELAKRTIVRAFSVVRDRPAEAGHYESPRR
jgi:xanthine dehydrogenase YagS FAD-binding subunit